MKKDPFSDLRNHIQELTDTATRRERQLMDENASLLNQLNAVQTKLRDGVSKVKEKAATREAEIAERLAAILDGIATESEVFTLEAPALTAHEPFTPPRAGSKGYQRRRNQRWPRGR